MDVKITEGLRNALGGEDEAAKLISDFARWKSGDEYGEYLFGKDGAYTTPEVDGAKNVLRHVHLVPIADAEQLQRWDKAWKHRSRKTSDRALVYVDGGRYGHLLIYILAEPNAHDVPQMRTPEHRELMEAFVAIAEKFLANGQVMG